MATVSLQRQNIGELNLQETVEKVAKTAVEIFDLVKKKTGL